MTFLTLFLTRFSVYIGKHVYRCSCGGGEGEDKGVYTRKCEFKDFLLILSIFCKSFLGFWSCRFWLILVSTPSLARAYVYLQYQIVLFFFYYYFFSLVVVSHVVFWLRCWWKSSVNVGHVIFKSCDFWWRLFLVGFFVLFFTGLSWSNELFINCCFVSI